MGGHFQWENVAIQEGFKTQEGFAKRRTRPSHCISDDVGKTEMSGNTPPLKGGQVSPQSCQAAQGGSQNHCGRSSQCYLYICRTVCARSASESQDFFRNRPREGILLGTDCTVGLAGVQDKDLVGTAVVGKVETHRRERQGSVVEFMEEAYWLATPSQMRSTKN